MDGYSISQTATRTGFPPTTLRFYEQAGLVTPARTPSGYRRYDDAQIEVLTFIGRAKGFGLTLEEINDLLGLMGGNECAPVQARLRALIDAKISDAQTRVDELQTFTVELRRVATALGTHTPTGPCDEACGCTTDATVTDTTVADPRPMVLARHEDDPAASVACTLPSHDIGGRLSQWDALAVQATGRQAIGGGVRLTFGRQVDIAALATLVAAEQDCCRFFTFALTVTSDQVALDVTGPIDAQPVIDALVGVAS